jgi:hypothetical protein
VFSFVVFLCDAQNMNFRGLHLLSSSLQKLTAAALTSLSFLCEIIIFLLPEHGISG